MLKIFQKYNYNSIIIIFFAVIALWLSSFLKHTPFGISAEQINAPLYQLFINIFNGQRNNMIAFSFIIFILQTIYFAYITNKHKLFGQDTFLTAFIYILFSGYFFVQKISPVLIANIFLLITLDIFIGTNKQELSLLKFLNASILLAISSLIYFPYVFLFFFALIAVIVIRSRITKEFFIIIFGFIISYLLFFEIYFLLFNKLPSIDVFWDSLSIKTVKFHNNLPEKIYFSFLFLIFFLANTKISQTIRTKRIELRTIYQLIFLFFIFSLTMYIVIPSIGTSFLLTLFIPLSFLFSNYFYSLRLNRMNRFLFFLLLLAPFIFQISILF